MKVLAPPAHGRGINTTLAFDCPLPPGTDKWADKTLKNAIFKHEPQKTGKTLTKMPVFEHGL